MTGIIILIIFIALIAGVVVLVKNVRKKHIVSFDSIGVQTRGGNYFLWSDLQSINYNMTRGKYNRKEEKVHSIHFNFPGGTASAGYLMPIIKELLPMAAGLKAPVNRKVVGYHLK